MKKIYVDNSSTSFPKAPGVSDVIKEFIDNVGCNVNRGGYKDSYDVGLEIFKARRLISDMFHTGDPQEVVFTPSVTYSLNVLLQGYLKKGDHIITTSMEHNSVMRPLHALFQRGIAYDIARCDNEGSLDIESIIPLIKSETKAIVMLHASNVCGTVMPVEKVAKVCSENGLKLIVDTAQTAGILDIDANNIDVLAFTGHKGLLGTQGIGGFVIKKEFAKEIDPIIAGGTGSQSDKFEQPDMLPDKFESGTMNIPAILGLKKAIKYIQSVGTKEIYEKEMELTAAFLSMAQEIEGVRVIGKKDVSDRVAVVSLDFPESDNAAIATQLDDKYNIMTRCGLHCAPSAHKTLNTYPQGTVRFSFGYFNTMDDVEYIIRSIKEIIKMV
ncbi:MAG: aminotransferase class V-fold PLP-dependent enzyme [Oscillospiraceae bacterium]|nr:aminotransferase class V-fold PLP-dependent enzyme [Oscillospiraceae bacterium]